MFSAVNSFLNSLDDKVWGLWLIILILATGIMLTVRLRGMQFTKLGRALKSIRRKPDGEHGEVSSLGALCTALSATIGTGNIVGVATAIVAGGPGAMFWMWLAALFGMATKYAECLLSVHYREVAPDGHILGGPFYTIEKGMGAKWKWLAKIFAVFGTMVGLFGIGTFTQVNSISNAVNTFFDPENAWTVNLFGNAYSWTVVIAGLFVAFFAALIIIGGLKRISKVAQVLVPFMAVTYVFFSLIIIFTHIKAVPAAFGEIFRDAFGARAAAGGALGAMFIAMQKGIARGIFSNEAGLGSAPIAASAAQVAEPVQQGLISMTGTFFDTIIICTLTGLVIVLAGTWNTGLQGYAVTNAAFMKGLPVMSSVIAFILMICLVLFAFTTILGWDYYSERCIEYLSGGKMNVVKVYRWLYIVCVFIGPYMTISAVWTIADIVNGLMAVPNIISLIVLSGVVVKLTRDYFTKYSEL
ncbi:MAG: sodium:alanine symporter family protein [Treponema sp.]|nr:sodium:alanine symporter family protein [Treponema sp.]